MREKYIVEIVTLDFLSTFRGLYSGGGGGFGTDFLRPFGEVI